MNKRTSHATTQARGSIKEAIGMLMGNPAVQAEGAAEKAAGGQPDSPADLTGAKDKSRPGN